MNGKGWREAPATLHDVHEVLGDSDGAVTSCVLDLAPSRAELLEAQAWLTSDRGPGPRPTPQGKVAMICEIIESELPDERL